MLLVCRHCGAPGGCLQLVAIDGASPPAAAAAAPAPPAGQHAGVRQADPAAAAVRHVRSDTGSTARRDGSWFPTCIRCG